ncbi:alpha/beta hydrolase family protein [Asticcacaulis sp. AC402]|uniref:alpha/beta hydrolase family protein n=1 Tax=Asticcacaulis sp. AC402 TaxID=1282361 RepID=UPI00350FFB80
MGRTNDTVLLYMRSGERAYKYYEVKADGSFSDVINSGVDVASQYNPATGLLAGFSTDKEGVYTYAFFDPAMEKLPGLIDKAFPDHPIKRIVSQGRDPRQMIVFVEGNGDPGTYYFLDFKNSAYKSIGETYPDLPSEWVAEQEAFTYKAADGMEIPAIITYPPGREGGDLPLIVLPHGGPLDQRDTLGFDWLSQAIASRGYVVLQPNYRGSGGYGGDFVEAAYGQYGRKMQTDLSDGVRTLIADGLVDPNRVCIVGASYGGYAALAGATLDTGVYRCAVSIAGISDLYDLVYPVGGESRHEVATSDFVIYMKQLLGDGSDRWESISPAHHADKVGIPLLMIHGKDDAVVPIQQMYTMREAMKKAGKPAEVVILKGEDHWLSKAATRTETLEATITFLETHNPAY